MKKLVCFLLILVFIMGTTACDFLPEQIIQKSGDKIVPKVPEQKANTEIIELTRTFYYKYSGSGTNVPVNVSYEGLTLNDESANKYPQIKQTLDNIMSENSRGCIEAFGDLTDCANQFSSMPDMRLYFNSNVYIRRSDSKILSLLFANESYSGGAHGSNYFTGRSIDVKTGKELSIRDITDDAEAFSAVIYNKLMENYSSEVFFDAEAVDEYILEQFDSLDWVADYSGITVIFNHYEIAPYASGSQVVMVPFSEIPGLKNSEYKNVPKCYALELVPFSDYYYNLDGDEIFNKLRISSYSDSMYDSESVHLSVDDAEIILSDYSYSSRAMLVHMNDAENYLYTQIGIDEHDEFLVHKLSSFGAKKIHDFDGSLRYMYNMDTELSSQRIFTNPLSVEICHTSSVISTVSAYRNYFVDKKGMLKPIEEHNMYFVDGSWGTNYTLLRPLKVDIIDSESGKVKETTTLGEGERLTYYRTDGEKICDLMIDNGEIARIEIDDSDVWPRTINGIDIEEIFDGIAFAG